MFIFCPLAAWSDLCWAPPTHTYISHDCPLLLVSSLVSGLQSALLFQLVSVSAFCSFHTLYAFGFSTEPKPLKKVKYDENDVMLSVFETV